MDLNEYLRLVAATQKANRSWRYGQTLFNVLQTARPDLGEAIVGTDLDPFHDDSRVGDFLAWLAPLMNTSSVKNNVAGKVTGSVIQIAGHYSGDLYL